MSEQTENKKAVIVFGVDPEFDGDLGFTLLGFTINLMRYAEKHKIDKLFYVGVTDGEGCTTVQEWQYSAFYQFLRNVPRFFWHEQLSFDFLSTMDDEEDIREFYWLKYLEQDGLDVVLCGYNTNEMFDYLEHFGVDFRIINAMTWWE